MNIQRGFIPRQAAHCNAWDEFIDVMILSVFVRYVIRVEMILSRRTSHKTPPLWPRWLLVGLCLSLSFCLFDMAPAQANAYEKAEVTSSTGEYLAANALGLNAAEMRTYLAPAAERSIFSAARIRRLTLPETPHRRHATGSDTSHTLLRPHGQRVGLDSWFSFTIDPIQASFVYLC